MAEKIVSHAILPVIQISIVPPHFGERWERGMANSTKDIDENRKARIKNSEDYANRVAGASSKAWGKCFADDFISRAGLSKKEIVARQAKNIAEAYDKYEDGLNAMFKEDGKAFKERLADGKKHYLKAIGMKLFSFTGYKTGNRGVAPVACLWLTNDPITEGEMYGGCQVLEGGPFMVTSRQMGSAFKAGLNAKLIQAGVIIVESNYDRVTLKEQNDIMNRLVQGFVDSALNLVEFTTGGKSHVDYVMRKEELVLEIQVSKK